MNTTTMEPVTPKVTNYKPTGDVRAALDKREALFGEIMSLVKSANRPDTTHTPSEGAVRDFARGIAVAYIDVPTPIEGKED